MTNDKSMNPIALLAVFLLSAAPALAQIPNFASADLVLGRSNFTDDSAPLDPPTAASLNVPDDAAVDPATRKVYVADSQNHRVLRYSSAAALINGAPAEAVFGQANFTSSAVNQGGAAAANTLSTPTGVFADPAGRLWIVDSGNNRVLMFKNAATLGSNTPADLVLGQPDFTTDTDGLTSSKMDNPARCVLDKTNRLWVCDANNNRVLRFDNAPLIGNGAQAGGVLGQPDFTTGTSGTTQTTMKTPDSVTVDSAGRLWVADTFNHRVLRFDNAIALANGAPASGVLGQTGFNTNTTGISASQFNAPISLSADSSGNLWVVDAFNNRAVRFDNAAAKSNGAPANGVIGQPDFSTTTSATTARQFSLPISVFVDEQGALWVSDNLNQRVLRFSPPAPDTTRPAIKIIGKKRITTARPKLKIKGAASDASGIAEVRYKLARGGFKKAKGTTNWNFIARLRPGKNIIRIVATDNFGNDSIPLKVRITRKPR
jgi:sugar lactone lactonase YvrE